MVNRGALLLLMLVFVGAAPAGERDEAPVPEPDRLGPEEIPVVDVEANVRKMLEAARREGPGQAGAEDPAPAVAPHKERQAPPAAVDYEPEDYVPVPDATITVRSVDDVGTVAEQLEAARKTKHPTATQR